MWIRNDPLNHKIARRLLSQIYHHAPGSLILLISLLLLNTCGKDNPTGTNLAKPFKVIVTPNSTNLLDIDQTVSLTASVSDQNGEVISDASVTWLSRNDAVAKTDSAGIVRAVGFGTAVITATSGQVQGNAKVMVSNSARMVLEALFETTDGENWTNVTNWLRNVPMSDWFGVSAGSTNQVIGPQSRSSVAGLSQLDLSNNQLTGEIPTELGSLSSLVYLDLSENALSGTIPASLGNLSNLETLRLFSNQLSEEIPTELGNLSNLNELSLHDNAELTGPLPLSFTDLDSLKTLTLSGTLLCAPVDSLFQEWLQGVENKRGVVNCGDDTGHDRNVLVGIYNATDGPNWKNRTNWLTEEPLETWHGVGTNVESRVDSLVLDNNGMSGALPAIMGNLTDLEMLDLSDNELSGSIPVEFGQFINLKTLDLANNALSGEIPLSVIGLPKLETLILTGNDLTSLTTERDVLIALYNVTGGPKWKNSTNWLTDQPLKTWYGVDSFGGHVYNINLSNNGLSGELPSELGNLSGLQSLSLYTNDLRGELPTELGNLTGLRTLSLGDNNFTGELPKSLGKLTNLSFLSVYSNNLSGQLPSELANLINLGFLSLSGNNLTGELPSELGNLKSLESLYLNSNEFTGQVPSEMTQLVNLSTMWLQQTYLCVPPTGVFQNWISGIDSVRTIECGTALNAPPNSFGFSFTVEDKVFSTESSNFKFSDGYRFAEGTGSVAGTYTYSLIDEETGSVVLSLRYYSGKECTLGLFFVGRSHGHMRYSCSTGASRDLVQWRLFDGPSLDTFDIDVVWVGEELRGSYRMAFDAAVERWESVITSELSDRYLNWYDLPADSDDVNDFLENGSSERIFGYIDDLRLYVYFTSVDGSGGNLGSAGVRWYRTANHLPFLSVMTIDTDDLDSFTTIAFQDLITHEIGHALGFGTIWEAKRLLQNSSIDSFDDPITPPPDTHFSGSRSISAFNSVGGTGYIGAKVPVENAEGGPGTQDAHWRNSVIGPDELMDGYGNPLNTENDPLSLITIESMADLGYAVDITQADPYSLPSQGEDAAIARRLQIQVPLNCFSKQPIVPSAVESSSSFVPLYDIGVGPK